MKRVLLALLLLASCASAKDKGTPTLASPTTAAEPGETSSTAAKAPTEFAIGDRVETGRGNFVTLHAYEQPVPPPEFFEPDPGMEYAAADIEVCIETAHDDGSPYSVGPGDFELVMPDNTRWTFEIEAKEPAMHFTDVGVGDCLRGWVSFVVPAGERPKWLVDTTTEPLVKFVL